MNNITSTVYLQGKQSVGMFIDLDKSRKNFEKGNLECKCHNLVTWRNSHFMYLNLQHFDEQMLGENLVPTN